MQLNERKTDVTGTDGVKYTFIGNYTSGKEIPAPAYYYYSGPTTQYANGFYKRTKKRWKLEQVYCYNRF